jgi:L-alanine-DL-glutamate epimerase-like enolase superfamily enzyme
MSVPQSGFSISSPSNEHDFLENVQKYLHLPILKIKTTAHTNLRLIRQLRSLYSGRIWIDANCAWTVDQAIIASKLFSDLGVEILEQPIEVGNYEGLKRIKNSSSVLLFADEDCTNELSILKLQDCVHGVCLKIHKSHGLSNIRKMITLAKSLHLKIMLGCRTENSIGISAISQFAGLADYLDLDGAMDIIDDKYRGSQFQNGQMIIPELPGIGVFSV